MKKTIMEKVKIFASIVDDKTREQVDALSKSEAYKDSVIRVMPDCHAGKGCTIGSVIQFKDRIVPNTVGVDISCGMLVCCIGKVDLDLDRLDKVINGFVPSGMNAHPAPVKPFKNDLIANVSNWKYIEASIGTLGGGNHFIEVDVDDEDNKYIVIHSGSRNLGKQVCEYWQNKAIANLTDNSQVIKELINKLKAEGRQNEIQTELQKIKKPEIDKELAYLEGDDLGGYLHDMEICQHYADENRAVMMNNILWHMGLLDNTCFYDEFTTLHNYIDIENRIIRKGAISAQKDEKVLIPMNMRDGSLICIGKGNPDWLYSAPHGAGRIMSRAQAFKSVNMEEFQESMKGIYTTSVCEETVDEAPMVYKDTKQIMQDILPTVEIVKVIKPIYNFKVKSSE